VAALLGELVATYIQHESNTDPLITITRTEVSPDYRHATVYLTTIPSDREADALTFLKRSGSAIRAHVKAKANLKIIPFFDFSIDHGERHRQHIDEVTRKIVS
jgi:ribosome-binding factor A